MSQVTIHNADGEIVGVVDEHLLVLATTITEAQHVSEEDSEYFSWSMLGVDIGTGAQTALVVQNTSPTRQLHIEDVSFSSATATEVDIHFTDEAALTHSGTNVVGVCLNRPAPKVAEATATADEVNNVQGLVIWSNQIGADDPVTVHYGGSIVLGNNGIIAVDITEDSTGVNCNITGYYHNVGE